MSILFKAFDHRSKPYTNNTCNIHYICYSILLFMMKKTEYQQQSYHHKMPNMGHRSIVGIEFLIINSGIPTTHVNHTVVVGILITTVCMFVIIFGLVHTMG